MAAKQPDIIDIYERVIALETKVDMMLKGDLDNRDYFKRAVYIIVAIEIIGIVIDYFIS